VALAVLAVLEAQHRLRPIRPNVAVSMRQVGASVFLVACTSRGKTTTHSNSKWMPERRHVCFTSEQRRLHKSKSHSKGFQLRRGNLPVVDEVVADVAVLLQEVRLARLRVHGAV
jgi:hypothetical protein